MKSIDSKKTIINRMIEYQRYIAGGLAVFSLATVIWEFSRKDGEVIEGINPPSASVSTTNTDDNEEINIPNTNIDITYIDDKEEPTPNKSNDATNAYIIDSEEHMFYDSKYLEYLKNNSEDRFDSNFIQIYKNCTFVFNNDSYKGTSIYIVKYDDGTIRLVDANNNKYDLLSNEKIEAKKTYFVPFRESSVFYELYKNGIITDNEIVITDEYASYVKNWDGNKHNQTMDLSAEAYAEEEYQKKFGGR